MTRLRQIMLEEWSGATTLRPPFALTFAPLRLLLPMSTVSGSDHADWAKPRPFSSKLSVLGLLDMSGDYVRMEGAERLDFGLPTTLLSKAGVEGWNKGRVIGICLNAEI